MYLCHIMSTHRVAKQLVERIKHAQNINLLYSKQYYNMIDIFTFISLTKFNIIIFTCPSDWSSKNIPIFSSSCNSNLPLKIIQYNISASLNSKEMEFLRRMIYFLICHLKFYHLQRCHRIRMDISWKYQNQKFWLRLYISNFGRSLIFVSERKLTLGWFHVFIYLVYFKKNISNCRERNCCAYRKKWSTS